MKLIEKQKSEELSIRLMGLNDKESILLLRKLYPKNYIRMIKDRYPSVYELIKSFPGSNVGIKLCLYVNDLNILPTCILCNDKPVKFFASDFSLSKYCSKCGQHYSPERSEAIKKTCIARYGAESHLSKNTIIRKKITKSVRDRYGVDNVFQLDTVKKLCNHHNSFKRKEYIFPSGRTEHIQGYEHFAINLLLEQGIREDDILTSNDCPSIHYENRNRIYFPDLLIKSQNRLIEVKSPFTYSINTNEIQTKQEASKSEGYSHEIWVIDKIGKILEILT